MPVSTIRCPSCGYKRWRIPEGHQPREGEVCRTCRAADEDQARRLAPRELRVAFRPEARSWDQVGGSWQACSEEDDEPPSDELRPGHGLPF